ncbi:MAG: hypothetical protein JXA87_07860 [Thermoleophilia bacterium]|nr:hypothetical protein [Thermoleophilia bacterium]
MPSIQITDGARVVVVEEAADHRPTPPAGMEILPDVAGELVVYEKVGRLREVPVAGRVKTKDEAAFLEAFVAEGLPLCLTERDGTTTGDWRIKTDPLPVVRRKDGDSADWMVTLTLWRMP